MKILKLETMNLASLEGLNVINFEEGVLRDSQIFSIVGPTGSGKSTILDAICLPLYGRAPRYAMKRGGRFKILGEGDEGEKNRLAPSDPRNSLTRGQKQGYSHLTFLANDGKVYRAEWSVVFRQKNYGAAERRLVCLEHDAEGHPVERECQWQEIETRIIGLDFEQFQRTVLIAQGAFAGFLTADEENRYQLLEKLVGNGDLYRRVAEEIYLGKDQAQNDYNELKARCQAYLGDLLTEEALAELRQQIDQLRQHERQLTERRKALDEQIGWYVAEARQQEDLLRFQREHEQALENRKALQAQAERLRLHDATVEAVLLYREGVACAKRAAELQQQQTALSQQLTSMDKDLSESYEEQKRLQQNLQQAELELTQAKPRLNTARELSVKLDQALKVEKTAASVAATARRELSKAEQSVADNSEAIKAAQKEHDRLTAEESNLRQTADARQKKLEAALSEVAASLSGAEASLNTVSAETLQQQKSDADAAAGTVREAIRTLQAMADNSTLHQQQQEQSQQLSTQSATMAAELSTLPLDALQQEVDTMAAAYTLMSSENWETHRQTLTDGQPCPLCGATHHPYASHEVVAPVLTDMQQLLAQKRDALKQRAAERTALERRIAELAGQQKELAKSLKRLETEAAGFRVSWATLSQRSPFPLQPSADDDASSHEPLFAELLPQVKAMQTVCNQRAEEATKALEDYNLQARHVARLRGEKEKAEQARNTAATSSAKALEQMREAVAKAVNTLTAHYARTADLLHLRDSRKQAAASATADWEAAKQQCQRLRADYEQLFGGNDPDRIEQQLTTAKTNAEQAFNRQRDLIASKQQAKSNCQGQCNALAEQVVAENQKTADKHTELSHWLERYNASMTASVPLPQRQETLETESPDDAATLSSGRLEEADIVRFASSTDDWEAIRADRQRRDEAVTRTRTTLENARNTYQQHLQTKPADDRPTLEALRTELDKESRQEELVKLSTRLQVHETANAALGPLTKQFGEARQALDDWDKLYTAVGNREGDTLRKMVQCYTLRFLVMHANAEIRNFNQRYELVQVKNSLGLRVIDHDRANDVRDTTSLSGGETFIVSLGLALGLSALSSRQLSFANLFIDEGFGTLDPEALATVIDALSMLQTAQGKKVCVISHTDTMSERITTQIRVSKNGNTGSSRIDIVGG